MRQGVRTALRVIVFLLLAGALFVYLNFAFVVKGTSQTRGTFVSYYDLEPGVVDAMYIGTSSTSRYFNDPKAYNDYGLAVYSFGPASSPNYYVQYLMREAELTQDPQLYIIELRSMRKLPTDTTDGMLRNTLDTIDLLSPNRPMMAKLASEYAPDGGSYAEFLLPILKYHSRLIEGDMTGGDFLLRAPENAYQGFFVSKATVTQVEQDPGKFTDKAAELPESTERVLEELVDYCDSLGKQVLFVLSPYSVSESQAEELNAAAEYVKGRGYPVLNCNNDEICEEIGIDWSTDYYNARHTNYLGSEKYTAYLSQYIRDHYDLPDRRGDDAYAPWIAGYEKYQKYIRKGIRYTESNEE